MPIVPRPKPSTGVRTLGKAKPTPIEPAVLSAQAWMPIRDLRDGLLIRADGAVVAGLAIAPHSLALKSLREQTQAVQVLTEALNGIDCPWQWLSVYRPVDLNQYLDRVDAVLDATPQGMRRQVLADYLRWATGLVRAGETVERKYYLLLTRTGKEAATDHQSTLTQLIGALQAIRGFQATPLDDARWRELLFLTFHAEQAAMEDIPDSLPRQAPVYHRQREEEAHAFAD